MGKSTNRAEPAKSASQTLRRRGVYLLLGIVLPWILLELIAFVVALLWGSVGESGWTRLYQPHPYRAYRLRPGATEIDVGQKINAQGLRGSEIAVAKPTDTIRIVCVGGSTTYGDRATTNATTYPALLEGLLNERYAGEPFSFEVLNAGTDAYDSHQVLIYFQTRLLEFAPDIVIIHTGINDSLFVSNTEGFEVDYRHVRKRFHPPQPLWWEYSPFLSVVFRSYASDGNPYWKGDLSGFIWNEAAMDAPSRRRIQIRALSDRTDPCVRNVRSLVATARGNGVQPVIMTMTFDPREWAMALALGVINARLRDLAESEGVPLIDFARQFPWNEEVFVDACHLIDEEGGLPRKAKIVFDFLIEQRLIEEVVSRRGLDAAEAS